MHPSDHERVVPGLDHVKIDDQKALTDDSTCSCQWTGNVSITSAGSTIDIE